MRYLYYIMLNVFTAFMVCSACAEDTAVSFSKNIFEKYAQTY